MPRKTRKEKYASTVRRSTPPISSVSEAKPMVQTAAVIPVTKEDLEHRTYFFRDLRKSLILVATVFTLEFLLYYATMNNYLKIIKF